MSKPLPLGLHEIHIKEDLTERFSKYNPFNFWKSMENAAKKYSGDKTNTYIEPPKAYHDYKYNLLVTPTKKAENFLSSIQSLHSNSTDNSSSFFILS